MLRLCKHPSYRLSIPFPLHNHSKKYLKPILAFIYCEPIKLLMGIRAIGENDASTNHRIIISAISSHQNLQQQKHKTSRIFRYSVNVAFLQHLTYIPSIPSSFNNLLEGSDSFKSIWHSVIISAIWGCYVVRTTHRQ